MEALMNGTARPTAAQKGQSFDLDAAMKAKMENAFGDLSAVKFYKSQAVGDAGAEAIAQGNEIAFAPGMADFSTKAGQERLGHELSHVMSQRSGAVRGSGFLNNSALEARADREGAMAAAGQQVYAGPVTGAMSSAAPAVAAAAPMQARRQSAVNKDVDRMYRITAAKMRGSQELDWTREKRYDELYPQYLEEEKKKTDVLYRAEGEAQERADDQTREEIKAADHNYVSEEDDQWLDQMFTNPDMDVVKEINRRRNQKGMELYQQRQRLGEERPGEDAGKLDAEASFSSLGTDFSIYDALGGKSMFGHEDASDQMQNRAEQNTAAEQDKILNQVLDISAKGMHKDRNPYLKTEAGKAHLAELRQRNLQMLAEKSAEPEKPKKKWWQFWK
jgi:hypothetical protein